MHPDHSLIVFDFNEYISSINFACSIIRYDDQFSRSLSVSNLVYFVNLHLRCLSKGYNALCWLGNYQMKIITVLKCNCSPGFTVCYVL